MQSAFLALQEDFQGLGLVLGVERGEKEESFSPLSMMGEFSEAVSGCEDLISSSSHLYSHRQLFEALGGGCELRCEEVTERG